MKYCVTLAPEGHPEKEVMIWEGDDLETGRALFEGPLQRLPGYENAKTYAWFSLEGDGGLLGEREV